MLDALEREPILIGSCGHPTGRTRASRTRCRMPGICSICSTNGHRTQRSAAAFSSTIRRGSTIFRVDLPCHPGRARTRPGETPDPLMKNSLWSRGSRLARCLAGTTCKGSWRTDIADAARVLKATDGFRDDLLWQPQHYLREED